MYHVDKYTYRDAATGYGKDFSIHKLNDPGDQKYLGPESHNFNYVSRISPIVFKDITGVSYETICKEQEELISANKKRNESCPPKKTVNFDDKVEYSSSQPINKITPEEQKESMPINEPYQFQNENIIHPMARTTNMGYEVSKTNNEFLFNRTYQPGFFNAKYHKRRNFKETYGYDKTRIKGTKAQQCANDIEVLKKDKLSNEFFNSTHNSFAQFKRKYNGFTSYEIPRTEKNDIIKDTTTPFNTYQGKMFKSLSCATIRTKGTSDYETLKKDNIDMKQSLMNQTNQRFLESHKLPEISKLANSKKKIKNSLGTSSKHYLGENFDPYTFIIPPRNRTGVNWVGALFQH